MVEKHWGSGLIRSSNVDVMMFASEYLDPSDIGVLALALSSALRLNGPLDSQQLQRFNFNN